MGIALGPGRRARADVADLRRCAVISGIYVSIFRGTPLLVQIFFFYFALELADVLHFGSLVSLTAEVTAGILALGINEGAYMREIIRAGIDSIDKGQMEAARSLGMRYGLAMRRIILPQAAARDRPAARQRVQQHDEDHLARLHDRRLRALRRCRAGLLADRSSSEYFVAVAFWYLVLTTRLDVRSRRRSSAASAMSERGDELSFRERLVGRLEPGQRVGRGVRMGGRSR